jgi:hypothetical protein
MSAEQIATERRSTPERPEEHAANTGFASTLTEVAQRVRTVIEQRPVVAVLTAVGVGYVIARLVSRGRR